ncbi:phosphopantothenoylcysteine decarboxylase/phosphopantothenate--cysteine ligase [Rhodopirellula rubra]|uniref:Phosphopantothenoylcysteine decarboxylase/phosphopantothenate--cysteine ligase n=1 Tax=Aporhodopirellula rubra TaxID=980271 RepID=A0A7W5DX14_9BACT|nr:flavoprotein [Aporhodopirellula rubra]MBB3205618.1 phosphopantothenoylcysteine decarboxylase/phosphopantothenate--cysteine ligase [Aporhodopirellula rubra]
MTQTPAKRILLGIAGGIAAYKAADLCSKLAQAGHHVQVVMTAGASEFIGETTLAALSGRPVATKSFDPRYPLGAHIELAVDLDAMVIAPATASVLARLANGQADDLLSTLYLQNTAPVLLAPAMSDPMWSQPAVQRNIETLRNDGCRIIGPEKGWLSCRVQGVGRMSEPTKIVDEIHTFFSAITKRS